MDVKMPNSVINSKKSSNHLKHENTDKEMKEYAETAMNELLGWYGYDKLNTDDTQALNLSLFSTGSSFNYFQKRNNMPMSHSDEFSSSSDDSSSSTSSFRSDNFPKKFKPTLSTLNSNYASCGWCHKIDTAKRLTFKMANSDKEFCSEICFTQYRRANFKRNKRCDWCRHVRHTVNYVDLQDGDSQYQFCSDKCLNQFKLDIFCQETKEHLEMHPHHQEHLQNNDNSLSTLITPDLWLKNCVSPSASDVSRSSTPTNMSQSPPKTVTSFIKKDLSSSLPKEESRKKKLKKFTKNISAKKKIKKSVHNLFNADKTNLQKLEDESVIEKFSSICNESRTPKVSFNPNFSSMLPVSHSNSEEKCKSEYSSSLLSSDVTGPNRQFSHSKNTSNNTQIPALLPITKSASSSTTSQITASTSSPQFNSTSKSLLPPPCVLLPYPIILPIPIPVPIPIPLPFPLGMNKQHYTDSKKSTEIINKSESNDENKNLVNTSPSQTTGLLNSNNKKRKRLEPIKDD